MAARKHKSQLSAKEKLVADELARAQKPMSAYDLIQALHSEGMSSPPTMYRALRQLVDAGIAHRIESLNAFVACRHKHHEGTAIFSICSDCGEVTEFHQDDVVTELQAWASARAFEVSSMTIELKGRCAKCVASAQ